MSGKKDNNYDMEKNVWTISDTLDSKRNGSSNKSQTGMNFKNWFCVKQFVLLFFPTCC